MSSKLLKPLLQTGELLIAPGIFDGISLRVAQKVGFDALYMTGNAHLPAVPQHADYGWVRVWHGRVTPGVTRRRARGVRRYG